VTPSAAAAKLEPAPAGEEGQLQVRLWLRLLTGTNLVLGRLRRGLRDEFGMTLPAFDLMVQCQRPPGGPTMSELSRRLMVTKGNVSALVERLKAKGWVECRSNPSDGRVQHVHLTEAGRALLAPMLPAAQAWLVESMAGMSDAALRQLHELLGVFKATVEANEAGATIIPSQNDRGRRPQCRRGGP
jgi:DNA-binding MarR family transcriptional regulator